jgi:hypothetical protein
MRQGLFGYCQIFLVVLVACSFCALSVRAQSTPSAFSPGRIEIIDAVDLVNEPTNLHRAYRQTLKLTFKSTPLARRFLARPFEVRIYRLDERQQPVRYAAFAPCVVYFATRWPLDVDGPDVTLTALDTLDWLTVAGQRVADGHFLLIFESVSDEHGLIRINDKDVGQYFKLGLRLTVQAAGAFSRDDIEQRVRSSASNARQIASDAQQNSPDFRCYRTHQILAEGGRLVNLDRCGEAGPTAHRPGQG